MSQPGRPGEDHVVATAGHVDHGKSALVRALTGIEPDRWALERRRGLTIDLGYAWTTLPTGQRLAFVDVPGHERFIGNMLAGLGPVPAVIVVVAADEGWRQQSAEHLAAVDALDVRHGLLVVTRSDLADPGPALVDARARIAATSLGEVEAVAVSALTGAGLDELRSALGRLVQALPRPPVGGRTRWWIDRSFTIKGAGTVVTGTLAQGALAVGDRVEVAGREVGVRALESLGEQVESALPVCRVAANLRGLSADEVARGDVVVTPGAWRLTDVLDVRLRAAVTGSAAAGRGAGTAGQDRTGAGQWPREVLVHVGTAAVPARLRPLGPAHARLTLSRGLPLVAGDRLIVRDPGSRALAGALVLDADPPRLARRGAAAGREAELADLDGRLDLVREVSRRGTMRVAELAVLGGSVPADGPPAGTRLVGDRLVADTALARWAERAGRVVDQAHRDDPLAAGVGVDALRDALGLPDRSLVPVVAQAAGLELAAGGVRRPGTAPDLGPGETGLRAIEERLREAPFAAPERPDLDAAGLTPARLAAAERAGRVVRLAGEVVLLPDGPARAMRVLAGLPQPFTLSQARQALGTTRRVAVPLLEHLDTRGWTRRVDADRRTVVR